MNGLKRACFVSLGFLAAAIVPVSLSASAPYQILNEPGHFYYGHVSLVEIRNDGLDPKVLRAGKNVPQPAALNLPIVPGDTILTSPSRRCEIQFDTGTILRLDIDTELKVETILAHTLSSMAETTNLVLARGRVFIMYRDYGHDELFQVMTGRAAVKLDRDAVVMIQAGPDGATDVEVQAGKAWVLYGQGAKATGSKKLGKLERAIVTADDRFESAPFVAGGDFAEWNSDVNANFEALHHGQSFLPKPILRYSPGIIYFAQKYSNMYGEWLWDDLYGYVWRPFVNDTYPWGNWRPYYYGSWSEANGQLYWVPEETWGWVPYHLGVWNWDKKWGWVWLPGSLFAPSWSVWGFFGGDYYWRPWSFWDWWLWGYGDLFWTSAMADLDWWGFSFWPYGNVSQNPGDAGTVNKDVRTKVSKDQLAQGSTVPKELKAVLKNAFKALARGDERIQGALKAAAEARSFVRPGDLGAARISERTVGLDQVEVNTNPDSGTFRDRFFEEARSSDPRRQAADDLTRHSEAGTPLTTPPQVRSAIPDPAGRVASGPGSPAARDPRAGAYAQPAMRFRDWNPDIRQAIHQGLTIVYSSLTNEVRCPELKIGSHDIVLNMHSAGVGSYGGSLGSGIGSGHSPSESTANNTSSSNQPSSTGHSSSGTVKKD